MAGYKTITINHLNQYWLPISDIREYCGVHFIAISVCTQTTILWKEFEITATTARDQYVNVRVRQQRIYNLLLGKANTPVSIEKVITGVVDGCKYRTLPLNGTQVSFSTLRSSTNAVATANAPYTNDRVPPIWKNHDDVIKWTHFPRYWPFVRGT